MSARWRAVLAAAGAIGVLGGCTERRIVITSEPPGARVTLNDVQLGRTPLEVDFTYYGVYDVRLSKAGYEPLVTTAEAKAPFYEWPVVDLAAMVVPVRKETIIRWHFDLVQQSGSAGDIVARGRELREQMGPAPAPEAQSPSEEAAPKPGPAPVEPPAAPSDRE